MTVFGPLHIKMSVFSCSSTRAAAEGQEEVCVCVCVLLDMR